MDPQACYDQWLTADGAERAELADAYNGWIASGGYPALTSDGEPVGRL